MTGRVFNIQRFSTHDGAGVRTTVFLKGCPLNCFWCHNPESKSFRPELLFDPGFCTNCGNCARVCPYGAVERRDGRFQTDREKCVACGACVPTCYAEARSIAGRAYTVEEVMEVIVRDIPLYANSGGGVTVSGGEPLAQPDFTLELLRQCHEDYGLHTAIETSAFARWETIERLLPYLDFLFVDVKAVDPEKHRAGTGVDNAPILDNVRRLAGKKPLCIRMPLIPGYNDNETDVAALGRFVRESGLSTAQVELLKFNSLGEAKLRKLEKEEDRLAGVKPQTQERMDQLYAALTQGIS